MSYNVNIREEIFGGTVYNLETGKRDYVTKEELKNILENNLFPSDSVVNTLKKKYNIKYTALTEKTATINHFSFADIAYLEVTRACNLRCKHCLNNSGEAIPNQLNLAELKRLVEDWSKEGIQEIRFTGGEPLVFNGIFELIELATNLGVYASIGTNATLVTKDIAKKLKKAGLKKAVASIDGTERMHDYIRGEGNYKKAIEGIKNLESEGINVRVNAVIMKTNMDDIITLAKELNKKKIPLFIRRFIESGRGENLKDNTLTKADYDYVREQLKNELENDKYIGGHYLRNDEGINHRVELPFRFIKGCKAGERAIVVTPEGDLHLCGFLAAQGFEPVGNVRNVEDWSEYWVNLHKRDCLHELRENLDNYNNIEGIQPTNCLAYVQRYLTGGKVKC